MIDVMIVAVLTSSNPTVLMSKVVVQASVGTKAGSVECEQKQSSQKLMKIVGRRSVFDWALWAIMKRSQSMVEQNERE